MADKIILDFEENTITFDTNSQKGIEHYPELSKHKEEILNVLGYELVDFREAIRAFEEFLYGDISEDEFTRRIEEFLAE